MLEISNHSFHKHFVWDHKAWYPFAVKIGTGKINAVTGQNWQGELQADPQDYVVIPGQTWIDGYCIAPGIIRQFVAAPLGAGLSAEEQLAGRAEYGGLQIQVYPMKRKIFKARYPKIKPVNDHYLAEDSPKYSRKRPSGVEHDQRSDPQGTDEISLLDVSPPMYQRVSRPQALSLAPGGRIRQEIIEDPFDLADWNKKRTNRCFVHLANSEEWKAMTGTLPPTWLLEAEEYHEAGLPWLELYREAPDIEAEAPRRSRPGGAEAERDDLATRDNHVPFQRQRDKTCILKDSTLLGKLKSLFSMNNS